MRLIDADGFMLDYCHTCDGFCEDLECDCLNCKREDECRCDIMVELANAPTVDAELVVHGKWREVEVDKRIVYCCTVCHTVAHMPNPATFGLYDYCPHCGAKMDGGADDE